MKEIERLTHPDCIDFKGPHLYVRILKKNNFVTITSLRGILLSEAEGCEKITLEYCSVKKFPLHFNYRYILSRKLFPLFLQRKKTSVCSRVSCSSARFSIRLSFGHIDITTVILETISLQSVELLAWKLRHTGPLCPHLDAQCSTLPAFGGVRSLTWFSHTEAPQLHCER